MNRKKRSPSIIYTLFFILIAVSATVWVYRYFIFRTPAPILPPASPYTQTDTPPPAAPTAAQPPKPATLLVEVNLAIPFVSQAPKKNWDPDHEEFCEEASALMAAHYINGTPIESVDAADQELLKIKDFEMATFGFFKDTDADFTVRILKEYYHIDAVTTLDNPTVDDIKNNLAAGKTILVPAAGRMLKNPHFTGQGPLYHMIVLKGYTSDGQFITNDPGTQFGADYLYPFERIMTAMHDWNNGNVEQGKKVIIIVG